MAYWEYASSLCDHDNATLLLPMPDLWPDETGYDYWIRVWHEVAHYLHYVWTGEVGHPPEMYAILTSLIMRVEIPMGAYVKDESTYKPRQLRLGMKSASALVLASYKSGKKLSKRSRATGSTETRQAKDILDGT